jgi:glutathione S-transferase
MQPILFYGVPQGCSFGSIVALEWSGLPYKLCRVQMPEVVSSDEFKRVNAVGETPSLMTETGEVLSESMAILNHIGARAIGRGLAFTQGSAEFDRLNRMLAFLNTSFFNAFAPFWYALEHDLEAAEKQALVSFGTARVKKAHRDLERMLNGQQWLLGDRRTLADAYFVGIARWADFHKVVDRRSYPAVQRLFDTLQQDPGVRFAHAVEHQRPAQSAGGFAGHIDLADALRILQTSRGDASRRFELERLANRERA